MATVRASTPARRFGLRLIAWSLALFGLLRLPWVGVHVLLPATRLQAAAGSAVLGAPSLSIQATLACSGADALALCLGAILAYPAAWRTRAWGAAGGVVLIVVLNTFRIATLGRAAASPGWFDTLHLYVWPVVLTVAIAAYVLLWMHLADRPPAVDAEGATRPRPARRFVLLTIGFLIVFSAASPFYLESGAVLALAGFIARAAAEILGLAGVTAHGAANVLFTPRGSFLVTQECVSTPLIPIYLAAVCAFSTTWRQMTLGILATLPLFIALGVLRLMVVALPEVVATPIFFVHAFYQLLLGATIVVFAAFWRHGGRRALGHALAGLAAGVLFVYLLGPAYARTITSYTSFSGVPLDDPQGAIALLPSFQTGLYFALGVAAFVAAGWKRFLAGFALLCLTQTTGLVALRALAHAGLTASVPEIRGWAIAAPVLIFAAVVNGARTRP